MFKHHLKTALRNILHRKLYSLVAALSLAIGLTVRGKGAGEIKF